VHRLLGAVYDATRLSAAAAWLESSLAATIGKVALLVLAAAAAGWAGSTWAPSAAAAAAGRAVSTAATAGVYLLAGLPAAVDLSYDVAAGRVDTHVLMNLAVLGTLVTGHALEVRCWSLSAPNISCRFGLLCWPGAAFCVLFPCHPPLHATRRRRAPWECSWPGWLTARSCPVMPTL
jgi:hypothetical protein